MADLPQHGLLRGGFVLPRPTRCRVSLAEECNRVANCIQKVLEDAKDQAGIGGHGRIGYLQPAEDSG
jgi:hypothetical protein